MEKPISEFDILTILYFYSKNFHAYILRIENEFFSEEHQTFFEILQKYYKAYDKVPPKSAMLMECNEQEQVQLGQLYDRVYTNIEMVKHFAHDFISDKMDLFVKRNFLKRFLVQSYDLFEQGDFNKIINSISSLRESIIDNDLGVEYHDPEFLNKRYDNEAMGSYIPTGYEQFDSTFRGWHKKALHIIAGPANSGKTMWLINMVKQRLLDTHRTGNKILYITLEIDKEQVGRRLDASLTGRKSSELWKMRDSGFRELIALSKDTLGNRVIIKEMPGKSTAADIEACMRNLEVVSDGELKPAMVVVDYLGLMSPITSTKNIGLYEKGLAIAVELRSLAQQYNIPFLVAAQTNRNSFGDRAGMDQISDSIGISQTADLMLTINRNEQLDAADQVEIYLAKSRFSKNGAKYLFSVDYDTMQVADIVHHVPTQEDEEM